MSFDLEQPLSGIVRRKPINALLGGNDTVNSPGLLDLSPALIVKFKNNV